MVTVAEFIKSNPSVVKNGSINLQKASTVLKSASTATATQSPRATVVKSSSKQAPQKSPAPVMVSEQPKTSAGAPSFFSLEGQKAALKRVADIYTFNYTGETLGIGNSNKPAGKVISGGLKAITGAAEIGSLFYGGYQGAAAIGIAPKVVPAAGAAGATAGAGLSKASLLVGGGLAALGLSSLFGGSSQQQQATQTTNPNQQTNPTQQTNPSQETNPIVKPAIGGNDTIRAGRDVVTNRQQYTYTYTMPEQSVVPTQTTIPTQTTTPSQSQEASASGTNWGLIALVALGAYVFLER